jgi:hypothetical protein
VYSTVNVTNLQENQTKVPKMQNKILSYQNWWTNLSFHRLFSNKSLYALKLFIPTHVSHLSSLAWGSVVVACSAHRSTRSAAWRRKLFGKECRKFWQPRSPSLCLSNLVNKLYLHPSITRAGFLRGQHTHCKQTWCSINMSFGFL